MGDCVLWADTFADISRTSGGTRFGTPNVLKMCSKWRVWGPQIRGFWKRGSVLRSNRAFRATWHPNGPFCGHFQGRFGGQSADSWRDTKNDHTVGDYVIRGDSSADILRTFGGTRCGTQNDPKTSLNSWIGGDQIRGFENLEPVSSQPFRHSECLSSVSVSAYSRSNAHFRARKSSEVRRARTR